MDYSDKTYEMYDKAFKKSQSCLLEYQSEEGNTNYCSLPNFASGQANEDDKSFLCTDERTGVKFIHYESIPYRGLKGNLNKFYHTSLSASQPRFDDSKSNNAQFNNGWTNPYLKKTSEDITDSVANGECFKIVTSLDSIRHLPIEEQLLLLFNENQSLKGKLNDLSKNYSTLHNQLNHLEKVHYNDKIESSNQLNNILIQHQDALRYNKKEAQMQIDNLLAFVNQINSLVDNNQFTQEDIRTKPFLLQEIISRLEHQSQLKRNDSKSFNEPPNEANQLSNQPDNNSSYYAYRIKQDCLPCSLGISNSAKGYSPLLCSPNRNNYINEVSNDKERSQPQ